MRKLNVPPAPFIWFASESLGLFCLPVLRIRCFLRSPPFFAPTDSAIDSIAKTLTKARSESVSFVVAECKPCSTLGSKSCASTHASCFTVVV
ncbi:hypothetical protein LEP1GSC191_1561 [Leptospira borgpetersenii serovar Mini str. 201000851]|nr:hypothetical protein LEP1GSC191_1561 [Leptospira borgpetersenii serovar Mini str. 201000851]